jgi:anion-transporting  ArsA/GET3 family ATPase
VGSPAIRAEDYGRTPSRRRAPYFDARRHAASAVGARELIFVTGKGGVGKTTVAGALGIAAARARRATVVCELGGQTRLQRVLGAAPNLEAVTIDPDTALIEWVARNLGRAAAALLGRSQAFAYLVAAAPGARELVTLGKAWDMSQGPTGRLVVVDGPSTGHAIALLEAPSTYAEMAAVSPVGRQAADVRETLRDASRTAVVLVAAPTEMAVAETIELATEIERLLGRPPDLVVMNEVLPDRFTAGEAERVERLLDRSDDQGLRGISHLVALARQRARAQAELLSELRRGVTAPVAELPFLFVPAVSRADLAAFGTLLAAPRADIPAPARRRPVPAALPAG